MISRRHLLAAGAASLAVAPGAWAQQNPQSLRALAAAKGLVFGTAAASYELKDRDFTALLPRQAAQVVPEYEMKRGALEPKPGQYDFSALDKLFGFAARSGMSLRGHPLVWYTANPPWLAPALEARRDENLMTGHIRALMTRYRLASVDVVNEALMPPDSSQRGWRPSPWLKAFGPRYLDIAFAAARAANPATRLVYNDFGCEQGGPGNDRFRADTLKLLDGLLARNVPIDALGLQAHLTAFSNPVDQRKLRAFLEEVRARGLAVLVTELDVDDSGGPSDIAARDRAVADEARRFLDVVLDTPATRAVLTWNLSDRYVDPPDEWRLKLAGFRYRKTPYDAAMAPKPLWQALARAFAGRRAFY
ncbi:MAG: endo-1,4-beta-xylanase [Alphaproteobacteria bacterium]|nr:endo-1,4-beta-xylanase [Alphaproteobacteria bacterium]